MENSLRRPLGFNLGRDVGTPPNILVLFKWGIFKSHCCELGTPPLGSMHVNMSHKTMSSPSPYLHPHQSFHWSLLHCVLLHQPRQEASIVQCGLQMPTSIVVALAYRVAIFILNSSFMPPLQHFGSHRTPLIIAPPLASTLGIFTFFSTMCRNIVFFHIWHVVFPWHRTFAHANIIFVLNHFLWPPLQHHANPSLH